MGERLFDIEDVPEVPLFKEPRRAKAARGVALDSRFLNDYPAEWNRCPDCEGEGLTWGVLTELGEATQTFEPGEEVLFAWLSGDLELTKSATAGPGRSVLVPHEPYDIGQLVGFYRRDKVCDRCWGMGRLKARVRREAGHRCERCKHPYIPKGDAKQLRRLGFAGIGATPHHWSPCDEQCTHAGPVRIRARMMVQVGEHDMYPEPSYFEFDGRTQREVLGKSGYRTWDELLAGRLEAEWRILTVHHLDGDKANCRWWNLAALCQRCHLEVQAKVVMERIYPYEHSPWFRPHAAGYYAAVYLDQWEMPRDEVMARMDELLDLEKIA